MESNCRQYWVEVSLRQGRIYTGILVSVKRWHVKLAIPLHVPNPDVTYVKNYVYELIPLSAVNQIRFLNEKLAEE